MRRQLAGSYQLHQARRTSIPPHMQVLSCRPLAYQDLPYCCSLRIIDLLSVLTLGDHLMKFLCPLHRKSIPLVVLLRHLRSEEGHRRLLSLMNLVIYPLTPLLLPWRLIARHTTVVVIIHLENRLVDLLVKASSCSTPCHHKRRLTTLGIQHTRTIITTHISVALVRNRDQCHQPPTAAVPGLLRSKLTQLVNQLGLHSPAQLLLSALPVCMRHMSKTILPSKKAAGTDGLQVTTAIGIASVVQGIVVTTHPTLPNHSLSTHHALHEHIVLLNLLLDHMQLVTGIPSLL